MGNSDNRIKLNVNSEIGKLEAVLLHKPGKELEGLTPDQLEALLFDDIPWLKAMGDEHDEFANIMRGRGTEVYYASDMLADIMEDDGIRSRFIDDLLIFSRIRNIQLREVLKDVIMKKPCRDVAEIAIAGLEKSSLEGVSDIEGLWDIVNREYPFYIDPVPNMYFSRDPAAVIAGGMSINRMYSETRRRESWLYRWIYMNHPVFEGQDKKLWYDYDLPYHIEGGDILVLSKSVIAIGCSQRTSAEAIEVIAAHLFEAREELREILVIQIPPVRAFMHLDTVFTMVDYDKFTIYPGIEDSIELYKLERGAGGHLKVSQQQDLLSTLRTSLKIPAIDFIQSGGGEAIAAAREQWNDSTNTLAISPGVVVTYSRNERSNEILRKHGIEVLEIGGSELVRGRGGPRCMSCPLSRTEI